MSAVAGENYTILAWADEVTGTDEQSLYDIQLQYFTTEEAPVNWFEINGSALGD